MTVFHYDLDQLVPESNELRKIDQYSSDKDARFGCKGKDKFWYGYKSM